MELIFFPSMHLFFDVDKPQCCWLLGQCLYRVDKTYEEKMKTVMRGQGLNIFLLLTPMLLYMIWEKV